MDEQQFESFREKFLKIRPGLEQSGLVLESATGQDDGLRLDSWTGPSETRLDAFLDDEVKALEDREYGRLSPRGLIQLEAIIEERGRPVSLIVDGQFLDLPFPYEHFNDPQQAFRENILQAIPSIGRIEMESARPGGASTPLGTGFIVGSDLMMTNRHVADMFVYGVGRLRERLRFARDVTSSIDFKREHQGTHQDEDCHFTICDVVMVHPFWDMALFRVTNVGDRGVLNLSTQAPEDLLNREIAVIGYPGRSRDKSRKALELEEKYFGDIFDVKRLAPGELKRRRKTDSFDGYDLVDAVTHDSSTLPGNSGAALVDAATGDVVALHFGGRFLDANFAVPTFELARDRRVVDAGVQFRQDVPPTNAWEHHWSLWDSPILQRTPSR